MHAFKMYLVLLAALALVVVRVHADPTEQMEHENTLRRAKQVSSMHLSIYIVRNTVSSAET